MEFGDITEDNLDSITIHLDIVTNREIDKGGDAESDAIPSVGWWVPGKDIKVGPYVTFHNLRKNGDRCIFRIWEDGRVLSTHHQSSTRRHKSISTAVWLWWIWTDSGHKVEGLPEYGVHNGLPSPSDEDWALRRNVQAYSDMFHLFDEPTIGLTGKLRITHHN